MPLALILGLLPLVPSIVRDVEGLFKSAPKSGPTKKQTAVNLLGDAMNAIGAVQSVPGANSPELNLAGTIVDAFVAYFNATGQFSHS